jgi:hypothetical protein
MWTLQRAPPDCDMVLVHDDDLTRLSGIVDSDVSGGPLDHMCDQIKSFIFIVT